LRVIGLDLSISSTGYAVWSDSIFDGSMDYGTIQRIPAEGPYADLVQLRTQVREIGEHAKGADLAVIEGFAYSSPDRAFQLGGQGFLVRMLLLGRTIPFVLCSPMGLRKFVLGSAKTKKGEGKQLMLREVWRRWNVEINDNNIADAYGLCRIGQALLGLQDWPLTKPQEEVLAKIAESQSERYEHLIAKGVVV
jgi:crossover junction endodeoxyribonuclease RuvC